MAHLPSFIELGNRDLEKWLEELFRHLFFWIILVFVDILAPVDSHFGSGWTFWITSSIQP